MQQRDRFDYVLIETTGLANPGPVAAALWTDEQLESRWGQAGGGDSPPCDPLLASTPEQKIFTPVAFHTTN